MSPDKETKALQVQVQAATNTLLDATGSAARGLRTQERRGPFAPGACSRGGCDCIDLAALASSGNRAFSAWSS